MRQPQAMVLIIEMPAPKRKYNWRKHLKKNKVAKSVPTVGEINSKKKKKTSVDALDQLKTSITEFTHYKQGYITPEEIDYLIEEARGNFKK
jgi:hypothetical protein